MKKQVLIGLAVILAIIIVIAGAYYLTNNKNIDWSNDNTAYDPATDPDNVFRQEYKDKAGNYFYENPGLGFSISLPSEFIYFQTQNLNNNNDFSDLEILIPTSDPDYTMATPPSNVPSYATPIIVRIFKNQEFWDQEDKNEYFVFGEKKGKIYTLKFWKTPARDWAEKWTDEMKTEIGQLAKVL